jgi:hypothetical protein
VDSLGTLISSVGTVVALAISLAALRQGRRDRRELRERALRKQATMVTVWSDWNETSPHATFEAPAIPALFVANTSEAAIYQVFVDYYDPHNGDRVRVDVGHVPPGATRHRDLLLTPPEDPGWDPSSLMPRLYFRDAEGRNWMRDLLGRLRHDPGPGNDGFALERGRLELGMPRPVGRCELPRTAPSDEMR